MSGKRQPSWLRRPVNSNDCFQCATVATQVLCSLHRRTLPFGMVYAYASLAVAQKCEQTDIMRSTLNAAIQLNYIYMYLNLPVCVLQQFLEYVSQSDRILKRWKCIAMHIRDAYAPCARQHRAKINIQPIPITTTIFRFRFILKFNSRVSCVSHLSPFRYRSFTRNQRNRQQH